MRVVLLVTCALLLPAQAGAPADTLTRAAAEKLTTDQLARRVLGMAGASMREAQVISSGPPIDSPRMAAIAFAEGGRQAGWPGLCAASVTTVSFRPAAIGGRRFDPPSVAGTIGTHLLWSVLPEDAATSTDVISRAEAEQPLCAARGAVLADDGDWFRATWTHQRDLTPGEAHFAAGLLRLLDRPDTATIKAARCDGEGVEGCPDAPRALARIDMLRPARVDLTHCSDRPTRICATIEVERQGLVSVEGRYTQVAVETDASTLFTDTYRLLSVTLSRRGWVV